MNISSDLIQYNINKLLDNNSVINLINCCKQLYKMDLRFQDYVYLRNKMPRNMCKRLTKLIISKGSISYILPNLINLTHIKTCNHFNKNLRLPNSLLYLKIGNSFNKRLNIPHSLIKLEIGSRFDGPLSLPNTLTSLKLGNNYNRIFKVPNNLLELELGYGSINVILHANNILEFEFYPWWPCYADSPINIIILKTVLDWRIYQMILPASLKKLRVGDYECTLDELKNMFNHLQ